MKIKISDIDIGKRYRKDMGNLDDLCESIKTQGLLQPIGITKDKVLVFGERRIEAYKKLGLTEIDARVVDVTSIVEGEFDENRVRKEFSYSERESIASAVELIIGNRRGKRTDQLVDLDPQVEKGSKTRDIAASKAGFTSNFERRCVKSVLATEDQDLINAMEKDIIDVTSAAKLAKKDKPDRTAILTAIKTGKAKTVRHAVAQKREASKVEQYQASYPAPIVTVEDYKTWLPKQEQCDLLITDPPYVTEFKDMTKYQNFVKDFVAACELKVKPTGSMYICIGAYPHEIKTYLDLKTNMQLQNILVWTYNNAIGPQSDKQYIQNYQYILYYRNTKSKPINSDEINCKLASFVINAPDGRQGNRYHTWQKPDELADMLIQNSSNKGDLILDPFACTGTFLLSANQSGRVGRGCDISKDNLDLAITRGCKYE